MNIGSKSIKIFSMKFDHLKYKKTMLIVIAIVTALTAYLMFSDFFKIDSCLDSGGKWSYETKMCES